MTSYEALAVAQLAEAELDVLRAANSGLVDALDAVLTLHERIEIGGSLGELESWAWCRHCGANSGEFPCPTVSAIHAAAARAEPTHKESE